MKSHITVIISNKSTDIASDLEVILAPYKFDEDAPDSRKGYCWDYWYFPQEENVWQDPKIAENFPHLEPHVMPHTAYIKNLPTAYTTSGIIDPKGRWIDLQDFGWRMLKEPSSANDKALNHWKRKCTEIFQKHHSHLAVQVILHS